MKRKENRDKRTVRRQTKGWKGDRDRRKGRRQTVGREGDRDKRTGRRERQKDGREKESNYNTDGEYEG